MSIDDEAVEDLIGALQEFNACAHEWRDAVESDGVPVAVGYQVCRKCGGGQLPVSAATFEQIEWMNAEDSAHTKRLPLDPRPFYTTSTHERICADSAPIVARFVPLVFDPRPDYSQNREDY